MMFDAQLEGRILISFAIILLISLILLCITWINKHSLHSRVERLDEDIQKIKIKHEQLQLAAQAYCEGDPEPFVRDAQALFVDLNAYQQMYELFQKQCSIIHKDTKAVFDSYQTSLLHILWPVSFWKLSRGVNNLYPTFNILISYLGDIQRHIGRLCAIPSTLEQQRISLQQRLEETVQFQRDLRDAGIYGSDMDQAEVRVQQYSLRLRQVSVQFGTLPPGLVCAPESTRLQPEHKTLIAQIWRMMQAVDTPIKEQYNQFQAYKQHAIVLRDLLPKNTSMLQQVDRKIHKLVNEQPISVVWTQDTLTLFAQLDREQTAISPYHRRRTTHTLQEHATSAKKICQQVQKLESIVQTVEQQRQQFLELMKQLELGSSVALLNDAINLEQQAYKYDPMNFLNTLSVQELSSDAKQLIKAQRHLPTLSLGIAIREEWFDHILREAKEAQKCHIALEKRTKQLGQRLQSLQKQESQSKHALRERLDVLKQVQSSFRIGSAESLPGMSHFVIRERINCGAKLLEELEQQNKGLVADKACAIETWCRECDKDMRRLEQKLAGDVRTLQEEVHRQKRQMKKLGRAWFIDINIVAHLNKKLESISSYQSSSVIQERDYIDKIKYILTKWQTLNEYTNESYRANKAYIRIKKIEYQLDKWNTEMRHFIDRNSRNHALRNLAAKKKAFISKQREALRKTCRHAAPDYTQLERQLQQILDQALKDISMNDGTYIICHTLEDVLRIEHLTAWAG